ncbi:hypothetical protein [Pseudoduganella ginsengisoli]|uniref:Uncharacterized protein n=1 Tax=Pseudoduganella ginsengisoli TaxID=1462440 RepID=A0A6L6Q573_9BURK|nr:hypothetical protein [Pseudoduganella ginsengisoli]MTW04840.1 hypothetical protein [Pseudoduganella ginsengisoli]
MATSVTTEKIRDTPSLTVTPVLQVVQRSTLETYIFVGAFQRYAVSEYQVCEFRIGLISRDAASLHLSPPTLPELDSARSRSGLFFAHCCPTANHPILISVND